MGRQKNDGRGKTGGRQKGTPNRLTADLRRQLADSLADRMATYLARLDAIDIPSDYCAAYVAMTRTILPKESSITLDTPKTIEDRLRALCEDPGE